MAEKKTILVTGATGAQGGSVVKFLLEEGKFKLRGLTRNTSSDRAKALQKAGVEMVQGDMDDVDSLRSAIRGCYGVFGVTNFWEHFDKEYQEGKNLIDAVAAEKIQHFVFSSLPPIAKISGGKLPVAHFDIKAKLEDYARSLNLPATFVHLAFYYENFIYFVPLQPDNKGGYSFGFPQGDTPLAAVSVEDVGGVITQIFDHPEQFVGKVVRIVGDHLEPAEYAEAMSKQLGKKVSYNYIPRETYASFDFPGADELANMYEFYRLYDPYGEADLNESRRLYPKMRTFATWLSENKEKLASTLK